MDVKRNFILVDLSMLSGDAAGINNYIQCVTPHLKSDRFLDLVLLAQNTQNDGSFKSFLPDFVNFQGRYKHFARLFWRQLQLPSVYQELQANLLFSPVPEMALWSKCRAIVMIHDFIPLRFPRWRSPLFYYHKFYVPEVARQAEHLICNSEATARDIVKFCGVPAKKISPILLGYDNQHFRPPGDNGSAAKAPYFLYLGRHDPHKNIARIISAFKTGKFSSETQLWLVGSEHPRHTPALHQQITELGLGEQVKFLDYVPYEDLPKIISQAIALVYPSLWEGFGLPILEAMGCGTPVITSNLASMPEVAGDAAILVDPYNTAEIADAMQWVAANSQLRAQLSGLGLARAKLFSWDKTGRETAEVLKRFL